MESSLRSLAKIFTDKIFRIPDYQRGYAWTEKHLKDFWNDLIQLDQGQNHYVGVLTVEKVPKEIYSKWDDDLWIIESKNYEPLYIVDGQQRLTTAIILIQTISEIVGEDSQLNYTTSEEIRKRFIYDSKNNGFTRSYIFGYEKDNPSYNFLKNKIFNEDKDSNFDTTETVYTNNLEKAKIFFANELNKLPFSEIECIYRKLTQSFLFNSYTISADIDVFIAFETMNNRGKPLSILELLKNRLIYLSTKLDNHPNELMKLRNDINTCWRSIYHNLGLNKLNPLDDDKFLQNHFIVFFGRMIREKNPNMKHYPFHFYRNKRIGYSHFLLEEYFITKNINNNKDEQFKIKIGNIYKYVRSLKKSVETWYKIFNPRVAKDFTELETIWLDKINRLDMDPVAPLIMVFFEKEKEEPKRIKLLKAIERYIFVSTIAPYNYYYRSNSEEFISMAAELTNNQISSDKIIQHTISLATVLLTEINNSKNIKRSFKNNGFYEWNGIRYFLFEYEFSLFMKSKTKIEKINWERFNSNDYKSIEHILPQTVKNEYWKDILSKYSVSEKRMIKNTLGNLIAISQAKNSSFQNKSFPDKIANDENTVGFRFGSYSENELTKYTNWTVINILKRGLHLINYMEKRWDISIGDIEKKIDFLNLKFVLVKENLTVEDLK